VAPLAPGPRPLTRYDGLANKQIARHLSIPERTVKAHLTSIFQRIGVTDRTQAALWAERNGLRRDPR
jgi:DNA-binding NarL/FixJ family response regulator